MLIARLLRKLLCYWVGYFPLAGRCNGNKTIYLTFDDGPDPIHSNRIMDVLAQYDIKAIFFLIGSKIENNAETINRMVREGHVLGNHTNTHRIFTNITLKERIKEIEECQKKIEVRHESKIKIFRPPQGLLNISDILYLLRKNYIIMLWSIDSNDHRLSGDIDSNIRSLHKSRNVILFHDDDAFCIDCLASLIPVWIEQGFLFSVPNKTV